MGKSFRSPYRSGQVGAHLLAVPPAAARNQPDPAGCQSFAPT